MHATALRAPAPRSPVTLPVLNGAAPILCLRGHVDARSPEDKRFVYQILDHVQALYPDVSLLASRCIGHDSFAHSWARENGVSITCPRPKQPPASRGHQDELNDLMLDQKPDLVIVIARSKSPVLRFDTLPYGPCLTMIDKCRARRLTLVQA